MIFVLVKLIFVLMLTRSMFVSVTVCCIVCCIIRLRLLGGCELGVSASTVSGLWFWRLRALISKFNNFRVLCRVDRPCVACKRGQRRNAELYSGSGLGFPVRLGT